MIWIPTPQSYLFCAAGARRRPVRVVDDFWGFQSLDAHAALVHGRVRIPLDLNDFPVFDSNSGATTTVTDTADAVQSLILGIIVHHSFLPLVGNRWTSGHLDKQALKPIVLPSLTVILCC